MNPLDSLYFYKYRINLKPREELHLPPYKGSAIRGLLGHTLRKIACTLPDVECGDCLLRQKCVYSLLMGMSVPEDHPYSRKYRNPPYPYVIEPPLTSRLCFNAEEILSFDIVLVGEVDEYLPYLIYAFMEMGERGIGRERGKFEVLSVDTLDFEGKEVGRVFSEDDLLRLSGKRIDYQTFEGEKLERDNLTLVFETPVRMKVRDKLSSELPFSLLVERLSERALLLAHFYCGAVMEDPQEFTRGSEKIAILKNELRWFDWERYSSKQETKMRLGGLIGSITYQGNLQKYLPLLKLGEQIHVGKAVTFGLGKYRIVYGA